MMKRLFSFNSVVLLLLTIISALSTAATDPGSWRSFRGPDYTSAVQAPALFSKIDQPEFSVLWKRALGSGYSGVSVEKEIAVTQYSDGKDDWVVAVDPLSGKELWRYKLAETYRGHDGSHTGPIATPLLMEQRVIALGPRGQFVSLNRQTGKLLWSVDLAKIQGATVPYYGYASSPLAESGAVILQNSIENQHFLEAYDPATGKLRWKAGKDKTEYQSPVVATLAGRRQILAGGYKNLYGIDAENGDVLWEYAHNSDESPIGAGSMVPLIIEGDRVLLNHKREESVLLQIRHASDRWSVESLWSTNSLRTSYSRPVYLKGYFYGYSGAFLTCVDAATGKAVWKSRPPGDGFLLLVEDRLIILTKKGTLHLARATPDGYQELARLELFNDYSWTPPSFAYNKIYLRSMSEIACIEIQEAKGITPVLHAKAEKPVGAKFKEFLVTLQSSADKSAVLDKYFDATKNFPVIEADIMHFVYRGRGNDLGIVGDMVGARAQEAMTRVEGTDFFYYTVRLLPDARINYRFIRDLDENLPDPLNSRRDQTPSGDWSWASMPQWKAPVFLTEASNDKKGSLMTHELSSKHFKEKRKVDVYLPAGYEKKKDRYPVIYFTGGKEAQEWGELPKALDNLIADQIRPVLVVFLSPVDPEGEEFGGEKQDAYVSAVAEEIVPFIDKTYRTKAGATHRASVGASFAGYTALYTALKHPEIFGSVSTQSAFMLTEDRDVLKDVAQKATGRTLKIHLEWATYDFRAEHEGWNIGSSNKNLAEHLRELGYSVKTREVHEGHSWGSWKNRADLVFSALFPPG